MPYKNKEQQKEYQRQWMANRRSKWFAENGPCIKCNSWNNLELDHINPEDKISHNIWSWSEKRIKEETAKCQVLCEDCHKEKTLNNKEYCYGENSGKTSLKDEDVIYARKEFLNGKKFVTLAKELNVTPDNIRHAVRKGWVHLPIGPIPTK